MKLGSYNTESHYTVFVLKVYEVLLYLVQNAIKETFYFSFQYNRLAVKDFQTTNVLGISEVCMARMVNGQVVKVTTFVGLYC
jgi:hypothetical protein